MTAGAIRVHGLKELTRDFKRISKDLDKRLTGELEKVAKPVADDAEQRALTSIRNMPGSPDWAAFRIGVSRARGVVFMVPASRGRRRKRPNLSSLLLTRAMDPAATAEENERLVHDGLSDLIDHITDKHGF